jgi:hypothetical protein
MIGGRYVGKLHDILLSSQDEILMKNSIRVTLESEYDYAPCIEYVLELVRSIVPRSTKGVVVVTERVGIRYRDIVQWRFFERRQSNYRSNCSCSMQTGQ